MNQIPLFDLPEEAVPPEERSTVELLAEVIGEGAAYQLVRDFGGTRLYVPRDPDAAHPLVRSIGAELAARVAHHCHGETLELPMLKSRTERVRERRRIVRLRAEGLSAPAIAREVHCSERHVYLVLAAHPRSRYP